jgi:NADH-quinone oxidoreductase subunit I
MSAYYLEHIMKKFLSRWLLIDIITGLSFTLKQFFSPKITVMYPDQEIPRSPRFRGIHALRRYENGKERCIACQLCEAACPAMAITIDPFENAEGEREAHVYEIDLFKCIFCGLCEESCPVGAIVETKEIHYVFTQPGQQILNKPLLLALGDRYEVEIAADRQVNHNRS